MSEGDVLYLGDVSYQTVDSNEIFVTVLSMTGDHAYYNLDKKSAQRLFNFLGDEFGFRTFERTPDVFKKEDETK